MSQIIVDDFGVGFTDEKHFETSERFIYGSKFNIFAANFPARLKVNHIDSLYFLAKEGSNNLLEQFHLNTYFPNINKTQKLIFLQNCLYNIFGTVFEQSASLLDDINIFSFFDLLQCKCVKELYKGELDSAPLPNLTRNSNYGEHPLSGFFKENLGYDTVIQLIQLGYWDYSFAFLLGALNYSTDSEYQGVQDVSFVANYDLSVSGLLFLSIINSKCSDCKIFVSPSSKSLFSFNKEITQFKDALIHLIVGKAKLPISHSIQPEGNTFLSSFENAKEKLTKLQQSLLEGQASVCIVAENNNKTKSAMDFFGTAIARRNNITSYADNSKVAEVSNIFKFMMASNHIEASTFFKIKNNEEITNYKMARGHSLLDKLQYIKEDKNLTITILDTETTGLDQLTADIIEFAAVKFNMDGIISTCDVYRSADVIKDSELSEEISELTGISYELLRTEGVPEEKFVSYVKDYMCSDIVIAYNSSYDIPVIYSNIPNCDILKPNQIIDLLDVTHALFPDLKSYKLGDVGKVLGLQGQNTHRAIDDVLLTYELFLYVINHLNVMKKGTQEKSAVSDSYVQCEKTLEFLWDLCSHAKAEEAIMYLKALGIHDVILKELWKDNSTVFMNLYRILLQPYKMIWGHVPVLTPYNLKNDYYDTLIVFSAKKEHLNFIKSRCNTCILLSNQPGTKDLTRMELI